MMQALDKNLRSALEKTVKAARTVAETAAHAAVDQQGVGHDKPEAFLGDAEKALRIRLRTHGKQLGDARDSKSSNPTYGKQEVQHLVQEVAYQHWHRMLFARFLADNNLLMYDGVAVNIEECDELAADPDTQPTAKSGWELAGKLAARMLPQIFRPDSPAYELGLPQEHQHKLEMLVANLPQAVFLASDSLGWVYQFWQANNKDKINKSGVKIGADELPSVTQLFTEDYMVDFLLDNTLGAWHAGKVLAANIKLAETADSEDDLRHAVALAGCPWRYLRFIKGKDGKWTPAAGTFDGWPKSAAALRALDPCMGSGHFVVAMFERMVALRLAEEKLDEAAAVAAVIHDNLFGLEIDPRCTQIGAFNLALAAWRRVGHCKLPAMNLACSGLAPNTREADWLAIAGDNEKLRNGMERLYRLFQKATVLGSLINPRAGEGDLLVAAFHELQPLLEKALAQETKDDTAHEMAVTAQGLAKAAEILSSQFTLVATNVPYLSRGKQCDELGAWTDDYAEDAKLDLATVFTIRCLEFLAEGATTAVVVPQNWLALKSFAKLRSRLLTDYEWRMLVKLGPAAFSDMNWWAANTALLVFSNYRATAETIIAGIDASVPRRIYQKEILLQGGSIDLANDGGEKNEQAGVDDYAPDEHFGSFMQTADGGVHCVNQRQQLRNHGAVVVFGKSAGTSELAEFATVHYGFKPGQTTRVTRCFWEQLNVSGAHWQLMESSPGYSTEYSGKSEVCMRPDEMRRQGISEFGESGVDAWGRKGIVIAKMGRLPHSIYCGELFDDNTYVLLPKRLTDLPAIWTFITSGEFFREVRGRNQKVAVDTGSMIHIPFDLPHWQKLAAEKYPHGLPDPFSSDPTQWLFNGHPAGAGQPLHVAVARLLGYQWPRQTGSSFPDCSALGPDGLEGHADKDGIVCIPPVGRESPASDRLLNLLADAYGEGWSNDVLAQLLTAADHAGKSLETWLRDKFFTQHCALFGNRPFVWHIWDGLRDGFSALVNYHKLDYKTLEALIYTYLGDWISRQKRDADNGVDGAQEKLAAAEGLKKRLELILAGEAPYDLFVRWKPIDEQPIGWNPDLNDGVRLNIRPFLSVPDVGKRGAGVLRDKPKSLHWEKDRGADPANAPWYELGPAYGGKKGDRINDHHLSLADKRKAREKAK